MELKSKHFFFQWLFLKNIFVELLESLLKTIPKVHNHVYVQLQTDETQEKIIFFDLPKFYALFAYVRIYTVFFMRIWYK